VKRYALVALLAVVAGLASFTLAFLVARAAGGSDYPIPDSGQPYGHGGSCQGEPGKELTFACPDGCKDPGNA